MIRYWAFAVACWLQLLLNLVAAIVAPRAWFTIGVAVWALNAYFSTSTLIAVRKRRRERLRDRG